MLKFSMELCYPQLDIKTLSVGTLGPKETSSEQTLNYLISQWKLQQISVNSHLFDSFTDLKESLLQNQIDLALVPHAYEKINDFYMEPRFKLGFIFTYPTPVYGLAKRKNEEIVLENCTLVTHPAPLPLLPYLLPGDLNQNKIKIKFVNSTSVAAIQVKQGLADLAITNENALREYDLEFISQYGKIEMSWSLFHKKENTMIQSIYLPVHT
ncbi:MULTISPECIES: LysR family transcriptional regulator [Microcystis]|uniref:AerD protein n=4 Tax=Microcystis TaxID=1125 RepID=L7ECU2_MICAE|nr:MULTISPECIES: LysR family transcriptional regulator [Microcystis]ACM68686.1 AerD [Microcystis aeruginosa NIES-98]ELP56854.1 AerD protein [Microcystis aeruginosa TAIHU98]MBD2600703.1 LysR family transcriptional regulator [Microcystis viridis FACHB-1342]MCA2624088.1 LysR family transcriptional regulator [Microcystis sp. M19BS1]MCA2633720.1 LysR family transcriptional regulator [Microcystis sp. M20BS1]